jgi:UDP-N-acetylmuramate--alanine ligase
VTRAAGEIGAGLSPARIPRPIRPGERIHVVGAAGAGASAAALLAMAAGATVSGCDPGGPSPYSAALEAAGIAVAPRHDPGHVTTPPAPERLAVTKALTAITPNHPELAAARTAGIPLEPWQQVVADAASGRRLLAVAGTHGKSTSSGWLVHLLVAAGMDPSAFVGALLPASITGGPPATARVGGGEVFVVEADEYAGNFDPFRPEIAVLTSAEWDHPDVFTDRAAVLAAFEAWIRRMPSGAVLVANVADPGVAEIVVRLAGWGGHLVVTALLDALPGGRTATRKIEAAATSLAARYATTGGLTRVLVGRVTRATPSGTALEIIGMDGPGRPTVVELPTAGEHNAANALGVAGAAVALGLTSAVIAAGLASFEGIGRRLERKGEVRGVTVYDDYGHHPSAIRATLAAIRQLEPGRRIWAIYEPLTFHRTAALLEGFAEVLATADAVAIADIWAGRDADTSIASASGLADAVQRARPGMVVAAPGSVTLTADWLAAHVRPGDVVLVMGGGASYRIGERLLELLAKEPA